MIPLPDNLSMAYNYFMGNQSIANDQQPYYRKWLRYYIDFCKKYRHAYAEPLSLNQFIDKREDKGQSEALRKQAQSAIALYFKMLRTTMIYTHTVQSTTIKEAKSPLDF